MILVGRVDGVAARAISGGKAYSVAARKVKSKESTDWGPTRRESTEERERITGATHQWLKEEAWLG